MKRYALVVLCLGLLQASFAVASLEEASKAYDGLLASSPPAPVMESDKFVFMEVKWNQSAADSEDARDEAELTAIMEAIERYIAPAEKVEPNSPFCAKLTKLLLPEAQFNIPNVPARTVKDKSSGTSCIKVMAFDAAPLRAARQKAAADVASWGKKTDAEWVSALTSAYKAANAAERKTYHVLMGCPLVNMVVGFPSADYGQSIEGCEKGWSELQAIAGWKPGEGSFFVEHGNLLWDSYSERRMFYPPWKVDDGGSLEEAKGLFRKGGDIGKILDLLARSIEANPAGFEKWLYLGASLKVAGKNHDAVFAYVQALQFDKGSEMAWKGLQDACLKAGFEGTAKGLSWYNQIQGYSR